MKIIVEKADADEEETIVVRCREYTDAIATAVKSLDAATRGITATKDGEIRKLCLGDIFWFEVLENRAFFYCENAVYESKMRLYEFEELSRGTRFFRATKSTVINADKIESLSPTLSGRFTVKLVNGERAVVSRGYVSALRKVLGI